MNKTDMWTFIEHLESALKDAQDAKDSYRDEPRGRYWAILATDLEKMIAFYRWYIDLDTRDG